MPPGGFTPPEAIKSPRGGPRAARRAGPGKAGRDDRTDPDCQLGDSRPIPSVCAAGANADCQKSGGCHFFEGDTAPCARPLGTLGGREVSFPRHMSSEMTDVLFIPAVAAAGTLRGFPPGRFFGSLRRRRRRKANKISSACSDGVKAVLTNTSGGYLRRGGVQPSGPPRNLKGADSYEADHRDC